MINRNTWHKITFLIIFCIVLCFSYYTLSEKNKISYSRDSFINTNNETENMKYTFENSNLAAVANSSSSSTEKSIKVPILIYHSIRPLKNETKEQNKYSVSPDVFEKELKYIKDNGYTTIRMDDLTEAVLNGKQLPEKPIAITFDDGLRNQYEYAIPLLKKYNMIGTFYIYTNPIAHEKPHFLTWEMVKEIDKDGHEIGSHTWTHPYLTKITDPKILDKEMIWSKEVIEKNIGHQIKSIAYPFGLANENVINEARKAGFTNGRLILQGVNHDKNHIYELHAKLANDTYESLIKYIK